MAVSSVGMFGDGITQGSPVSSKYMSRDQPSIVHHAEVRADAEVRVEERGQLADRHAVPHRDREEADERLEPGLEHRALDRLAADRVRPVAHDDREPVRAAARRQLAIV